MIVTISVIPVKMINYSKLKFHQFEQLIRLPQGSNENPNKVIFYRPKTESYSESYCDDELLEYQFPVFLSSVCDPKDIITIEN